MRNAAVRWSRVALAGALALLVAGRAQGQTPAGPAPAPVEADVTEAAASVDGLHVAVFATAYLGAEPGASVLVGTEVRRASPSRGRAEGRTARRIELRFEATGGAAPAPRTVTVPLEADAPVDGGEPVRVLTRLALQPGRHDLRVTVREVEGGDAGEIVHPLIVPDLASTTGSISMSGLLLASSHAPGITRADEGEEHRQLPILLQPPTARRTFSPDERLEVYAELYDWESELEFEQQLSITTRVRTAGGDVAYTSEDTGQSETLTSGRFGYAHSALVPIAGLAPGRYLLEVEARPLDGDPSVAHRAVPFSVGPPPGR